MAFAEVRSESWCNIVTLFNGLDLVSTQELDLLKEFEKKDVLLKTRSAAKKAEQQEIEVRKKCNPKPTANSPEFDSNYESLTHIWNIPCSRKRWNSAYINWGKEAVLVPLRHLLGSLCGRRFGTVCLHLLG